MPKVLLICMPWSEENNPALGISLLKAILARNAIPTDIAYLSLRWSELVHQFCREAGPAGERARAVQLPRRGFADEWVFSQCLYGRDGLDAAGYVRDILRRHYTDGEVETWLALRDVAERFLDECMTAIPWEDYFLVGFTSTFRQHLASLCLAQRLKQRYPRLRIAFGGANCQREMGAALMRHFPFVDYVADGDADHSFPALVQSLIAGETPAGIQGILWRDGERVVDGGPADPVRDLDALPSPDYDDYYAQLAACSFKDALEVRLLLEGSRGCWWGQRRPCTFCGLNGATREYRAKSAGRALAELLHLLGRYPVSLVVYTDTILDYPRFRELFSALARDRPGGTPMFFNARATLRKPELRALRRAGVPCLQVGIESLSTRVLKIMNKGLTALQTIQGLKRCLDCGVDARWHLLYGFPSEEPADYAAMLPLLRAVSHLAPPRSYERIQLVRFSGNFCHAEELGFAHVRPAAAYRYLFPFPESELFDLAYHFDYDYADGRDPESYVAEVKAFVDDWQTQPRGELLHVRLEDGCGRIHDTRFNRVVDRLELDPFENSLYERCDEIRAFDGLARFLGERHPAAFTECRLREALDRLIACRMMVGEGGRYLAVALSDALAADELPPEERDWLAVVA